MVLLSFLNEDTFVERAAQQLMLLVWHATTAAVSGAGSNRM